MNDFTILQEEILKRGWLAVLNDIEKIETPINRAIERHDFFEVIKTLPIELNGVDGIDTVLLAEQLIKDSYFTEYKKNFE